MNPSLVALAIDRAKLNRLLGAALRDVGGSSADRQRLRRDRRIDRKEITSALYKNGEEIIRLTMRLAREAFPTRFTEDEQQVDMDLAIPDRRKSPRSKTG